MMSLAIDVDRVDMVLLADGWHVCEPCKNDRERSSFDIDSYEFIYHDNLCYASSGVTGVCSTGASWIEERWGHLVRMSCPLTAILAVVTRP